MENPKVSIIIPLYNYAEYIGDCIRSCMDQTYDNFEVIVVDDASTDNGGKVVEGFNSKIRHFRFEMNLGFVYARNFAIQKSKGEFIVPIDADDMLTPKSLEVRLRAFEKKPILDFVHGVVYDDVPIDATYEWCLGHTMNLKNSKRTRRQFTKEHKGKIHAQGMMFRKSVFERFGLYFDILSKPDKELMYRLGIHPLSPFKPKVNFKKVDEFVPFYRRHDDSMKSSLKEKRKKQLKDQFDKRMADLKINGITRKNTEWLSFT